MQLFIPIFYFRNADVPHALVRNMCTKSWSAFDRLLATMPPGGSFIYLPAISVFMKILLYQLLPKSNSLVGSPLTPTILVSTRMETRDNGPEEGEDWGRCSRRDSVRATTTTISLQKNPCICFFFCCLFYPLMFLSFFSF